MLWWRATRKRHAICARPSWRHSPTLATTIPPPGVAAIAACERIGQRVEELALCIERRLRRRGGDLARSQRQPARVERTERQRNAAIGVEGVHQRIGDVVLIDVEAVAVVRRRWAGRRWRCVIQREVEIGVVAVMGERALQIGRQVGVDRPGERAADATIGGEDGVALLDVASRCERRRHRCPTQLSRSGDMGEVAVRRRHFDHVGRGRRHHQIAGHRQRTDRVARCQRAAVDRGVTHRAVAAERATGIHRRQRRRRNRAVHRQRAGIHRRRTGVGVQTRQGLRTMSPP